MHDQLEMMHDQEEVEHDQLEMIHDQGKVIHDPEKEPKRKGPVLEDEEEEELVIKLSPNKKRKVSHQVLEDIEVSKSTEVLKDVKNQPQIQLPKPIPTQLFSESNVIDLSADSPSPNPPPPSPSPSNLLSPKVVSPKVSSPEVALPKIQSPQVQLSLSIPASPILSYPTQPMEHIPITEDKDNNSDRHSIKDSSSNAVQPEPGLKEDSESSSDSSSEDDNTDIFGDPKPTSTLPSPADQQRRLSLSPAKKLDLYMDPNLKEMFDAINF